MAETLENLCAWASDFPEWALCPLLFVLAIVQYVFPPIPSDTLLVALGMLVSAKVFDPFFGFLSYSLGAVIGALALYEVCFIFGDKVRKIGFINNLIDENRLQKARSRIEKFGGAYYFILRFVPSMQCITIIVMGFLKIKRINARIYIGSVTFAACIIYYLLGLFLGSNIPRLVKILDALGIIGWILLAAVIISVIFIVIIRRLNKRENK